jgi:hypothetical protein
MIRRILKAIVIAGIAFGVFEMGYRAGRIEGYGRGFERALDTMTSILSKQTKSDTSVSKLIFIHPDTDVYILSRKTVLPK